MPTASRPTTRTALSLLSTLAFAIAGASVTVAATDCYVANGKGLCCAAVGIDCGSGEQSWTCVSSASSGSTMEDRVRQAAAGESGKQTVITGTTTCAWIARQCGPEIGSCVDVATYPKLCSGYTPYGGGCVGAAQ